MRDNTTLTEKQDMFVKEYLIDLNATQAAIRSGYSEKTAQEQSSRLLSNVMIAEAVAKAQQERSERTEITQDDVVRGLLKEAQFTGTGATHGARVSAWSQLGKHLGMFTDRVDHTLNDGRIPFPDMITIRGPKADEC